MQINDTHKSKKGTIALAVGCFLLQVMLSPNIGLENGSINFAVVFAGICALNTGGRKAVVCGFVAGLIYDLLTTGPMGLMAGLLTVFSFALGYESRNRFADGFVATLSTFGVGSLAVIVAYNLTMSFLGVTNSIYDLVVLHTLPSFAMTFVAFLPFAYVQVKKGAKGKWMGKSRKSSGLGAGHYDVRDL